MCKIFRQRRCKRGISDCCVQESGDEGLLARGLASCAHVPCVDARLCVDARRTDGLPRHFVARKDSLADQQDRSEGLRPISSVQHPFFPFILSSEHREHVEGCPGSARRFATPRQSSPCQRSVAIHPKVIRYYSTRKQLTSFFRWCAMPCRKT